MNESKDDEMSSSTSTSRLEKLISKVKDLEEELNRSKNANVESEEKRKALEAKYDAYDSLYYSLHQIHTHTHTHNPKTDSEMIIKVSNIT